MNDGKLQGPMARADLTSVIEIALRMIQVFLNDIYEHTLRYHDYRQQQKGCDARAREYVE